MQIEASEKQPIKIDQLADEINDKCSQAVKLAGESIKCGNAAVVAAIECGKLLTKAKSIVGHGNWLNWLEGNTDVSDQTARKWMRLSNSNHRLNLDNCKNITDAYQACGILPPPTKASNGTGTHDVDIYSEFTARVTKPAQRITVLFSDYDVKAIPIEHKEKIKEELKPIVEFYQGL